MSVFRFQVGDKVQVWDGGTKWVNATIIHSAFVYLNHIGVVPAYLILIPGKVVEEWCPIEDVRARPG